MLIANGHIAHAKILLNAIPTIDYYKKILLSAYQGHLGPAAKQKIDTLKEIQYTFKHDGQELKINVGEKILAFCLQETELDGLFKCVSCRQAIKEGARFCGKCGAKQYG